VTDVLWVWLERTEVERSFSGRRTRPDGGGLGLMEEDVT